MIAPFEPFQQLADETVLKIFSYLDPCELSNCCFVSRRWGRVASDNTLWKPLYPRWGFGKGVNIKETMSELTVRTKECFVDKLKELLENIDKDDNRMFVFRCSFLYDPKRCIEVKIGYNLPINDPDISLFPIFTCFEKQEKFKNNYSIGNSVSGVSDKTLAGESFLGLQITKPRDVCIRTDVEVRSRDGSNDLCYSIDKLLRSRISELYEASECARKREQSSLRFIEKATVVSTALIVAFVAYKIFL